MKRKLLHLMLSLPLVTASSGLAFAQDGPLLPGLEFSAAAEVFAAPTSESGTPAGPVIVPSGDDIRPLDDQGNPQSDPRAGGLLKLPEPPAIEPKVEEPPKRNWLQKSTDAVRNLTTPETKGPGPKSPAPTVDEKNTSDAIRNRQMLRRQPATTGQSIPDQRVQPPRAVRPQPPMPTAGNVPQRTLQSAPSASSRGTVQSNRSFQSQPTINSQRTVPTQPQTRPQTPPPVGVEARSRGYQQPSSRRPVQAIPGQPIPPAKSQLQAPQKTIDPRRTVDNSPRSPWERPPATRLRPAAPAIKATPTQGTATRPSTLRSTQGYESPRSK